MNKPKPCPKCGLAHTKGEVIVVTGIKDNVPAAQLTCQHAAWRKPQ